MWPSFGLELYLPTKFSFFVERVVAEQKRQKKENERQQREMVSKLYLEKSFKSLVVC